MSPRFLALLTLVCLGNAAFAAPLRPNRWTVPTYRGNTERIVFADGQTKVMVFLSRQCPASLEHERLLGELASEFREFRFIGVHANADEDPTLAGPRFRLMPFTVVSDPYGQLADTVGATQTPYVVIVGGDGRVRYRGGVTDAAKSSLAKKVYLRNALTDLSRNEEIDEPRTDARGCKIVRTAPAPKPIAVPENLGTY